MLCHFFSVACETGLSNSLVDQLTLLGIAFCLWAALGFPAGDGSSSSCDSDGGGGCDGD